MTRDESIDTFVTAFVPPHPDMRANARAALTALVKSREAHAQSEALAGRLITAETIEEIDREKREERRRDLLEALEREEEG